MTAKASHKLAPFQRNASRLRQYVPFARSITLLLCISGVAVGIVCSHLYPGQFEARMSLGFQAPRQAEQARLMAENITIEGARLFAFREGDILSLKLKSLSDSVGATALRNEIGRLGHLLSDQLGADERRRQQEKLAGLERELDKSRAEEKATRMRIQSYRIDLKPEDRLQQQGNAEQLAGLETEQAQDRVAKAGLDEQIRLLRRLSTDIDNSVSDSLSAFASEEMPQVLQAMARLRESYMQGAQRLEVLQGRYGEKHPVLKRLQTELDHIRVAIKGEADAIGKALRAKRDVLDAQMEQRAAEIETIQKNHVLAQNDETELDAMNEALKRVQERISTLDARKTLLRIDLAQPPARPLMLRQAHIMPIPAPERIAVLGLIGGFAGLLLGWVVVSLLSARKAARFRHENLKADYHQYSACAVAGMIPKSALLDQRRPSDLIFSRQAEDLAEAVRQLRLSVRLSSEEKDHSSDSDHVDGHRLVICSPDDGAGKTSLAVWLGQVAARAGEKAIILDANLRAPRLHMAFGKMPDHNLVDYLSEQASLEDVIIRDDPSSVHVIWGADVHKRAPDLLTGKRMRSLLKALHKAYDLIIIDTPALNAVPDGLVMADWADQVLLCTPPQKPHERGGLASSLSTLHQHRLLKKTSIVLMKV